MPGSINEYSLPSAGGRPGGRFAVLLGKRGLHESDDFVPGSQRGKQTVAMLLRAYHGADFYRAVFVTFAAVSLSYLALLSQDAARRMAQIVAVMSNQGKLPVDRV